MNVEVWLLLWQGLAAGSAFWLRPAGWLWLLLAVALTVLVEWLAARYAGKHGITDHGKLLEPAGLAVFQSVYTMVLTFVVACALSLQGQWLIFWILLAGSAICLAGTAAGIRHGQDT